MQKTIPKILFITPSFSKGGAEKNMLNVINSLKASEFNVILIVVNNEIDYSKLITNTNVEIITLNKPSVSGALGALKKQIKNIKPDIVFSSATNIGIQLVLFKKIYRLKFINIIRIPTLPSNKLSKIYSSKSLLFYKSKILSVFDGLLKYADYIISQTPEMKDEIIEYYKVPANKIITIPNIVNESQLKLMAEEFDPYNKEDYNIVSVGTLYSVKGYDFLIEGFADFLSKQKDKERYKLHIVGEDRIEKGYINKLEKLINDLDVDKNVFLLGHKDNPYPYIKNANLYVLSSIKEGFPNVVLEALFLGVFVIATDCVNFDEFIDNGNNGYIIPKGDSPAISKAIEKSTDKKSTQSDIKNFNFNQWFNLILCESYKS